MAGLKTQKNDASVDAFLADVADDKRRQDAETVCRWMQDVTGEPPAMWGKAIIGFGSYRYTYASGREGEWFPVGLSPRKQALTVYLLDGFEDHKDLLADLGKHKIGKCCLYIKKLEDVDEDALKKLIQLSYDARQGAQRGHTSS